MRSMSDEKKFRLVVTIILTLFSIVALFPLVLLVVASFTEENELITRGYQILPRKWSLEAYRYKVRQASKNTKAELGPIGKNIVGPN